MIAWPQLRPYVLLIASKTRLSDSHVNVDASGTQYAVSAHASPKHGVVVLPDRILTEHECLKQGLKRRSVLLTGVIG